jgi:Zn finger protein HypA/HybF involved in hydrogenase expression
LVQTAAQEAGITSVTRMKVIVGSQWMVIPDALLFAFSCIKKNSCAKTAILEIESTAGRDLYID